MTPTELQALRAILRGNGPTYDQKERRAYEAMERIRLRRIRRRIRKLIEDPGPYWDNVVREYEDRE